MSVQLTKEQTEKLKELRKKANCSRQISLCIDDFDKLPPVKLIGINGLLQCQKENTAGCLMAMHFGDSYFCKCPVRSYLHREIGI